MKNSDIDIMLKAHTKFKLLVGKLGKTEIVKRLDVHYGLVSRLKDNTEALLDFHKAHPKLFGEFFGAKFVEMNEEVLAKVKGA